MASRAYPPNCSSGYHQAGNGDARYWHGRSPSTAAKMLKEGIIGEHSLRMMAVTDDKIASPGKIPRQRQGDELSTVAINLQSVMIEAKQKQIHGKTFIPVQDQSPEHSVFSPHCEKTVCRKWMSGGAIYPS